MDESKSIFQSKTFWFGVASALVTLLESQEIINLIPAEYQPLAAMVVMIINGTVLRGITSSSVTLLGRKPETLRR